MRTLLIAIALFWAHTGLAQTSAQLRAFILPLTADDVASAETESGFIVGDQSLLLFRLRDGSELGRQVPAAWVSKKGLKWKTCLISESHLLESTVKRVEVSNGELVVEFVRDGIAGPLIVRIKLIPRDDLGLIFLSGVGVESQQSPSNPLSLAPKRE